MIKDDIQVNDKHISLDEQPGNFDLEFIDELKQELSNQNQDNKQDTNNEVFTNHIRPQVGKIAKTVLYLA